MQDDSAAPPGRRTEARGSALSRLGSHWMVSGHGKDLKVREMLGDPELAESTMYFPAYALSAAVNEARQRRSARAKRDLQDCRDTLRLPSSRVAIAFSRIGLHPQGEAVLNKVCGLQVKIEDLEEGLAIEGTTEEREIKVERLPDILRLPAPIEIGDTVWEVGYEWPIEHGTRLCECRVVRIHVSEAFGKSDYDAELSYECRRRNGGTSMSPSGSPRFSYQRDDFSDPCIDSPTRSSSKLFLTREAAVAHLTEIAAVLGTRAAEAEATARSAAQGENTQ